MMSVAQAACAQPSVCVTVQVGNLTTDVNWWDRPEAMTEENMKRPAYAINTRMGASDIAGWPSESFPPIRLSLGGCKSFEACAMSWK